MGAKRNNTVILALVLCGVSNQLGFVQPAGWGISARLQALHCRVDGSGVVDSVWATSSRPNPPSKDEAEWKKERQNRQQKLHSQKESSPDLFASKISGKRLAEDIKANIQQSGRAMIRAVGPASTYQALKAIAAATAMLQKSEVSGEQVIAAAPSFKQIRLDEEDTTTVTFLNCMLLPRSRKADLSLEATQILATGSRAKVSKMAAAIKNRIRENSIAVALAVGRQQVSLSIKAIVQAGRFLRQDQGAVGEAAKVPSIAFIPKLQEFAPKMIRPRKEMKKGEDDAATIGMRLECVDVTEKFKDPRSSPKEALPPWELA